MNALRVQDDVGPRRGRRMGIGVCRRGAIVLVEEERQKIELHQRVAGVGLGVVCESGESLLERLLHSYNGNPGRELRARVRMWSDVPNGVMGSGGEVEGL
jgi:hypothetical protein